MNKVCVLICSMGFMTACLALTAGCQREVAYESDVEVRSDGTVRSEEVRVTEDADGTIRIRESERTDPR